MTVDLPAPTVTTVTQGEPSMCTVEGCDRRKKTRHMCAMHYSRWARHGNPHTVKKNMPTMRNQETCQIDDCQQLRITRGLCDMHYSRWKRYGTTDLAEPKTCTVEGCDRKHDARGLCHMHYCRQLPPDRDQIDRANHLRRTRKAAADDYTITDRDARRIKSQPCQACGSTDTPTMEHLIPISRGGSHGIGNLTTLCLPCNASKNNLTWMEWLTSGRPLAPTPDTKAH